MQDSSKPAVRRGCSLNRSASCYFPEVASQLDALGIPPAVWFQPEDPLDRSRSN
jgi:hypothetical protein